MQTLKRNQQTIYYKNYVSQTPKYDAYGNETGEYVQTYSALKNVKAYVSANQGETSERMFGEQLDYDKVLILKSTDIDEHSILWVEQTDTTKPYDYIVRRVAKSLNSYAIAIKKVEVSNV